MKLAFDISIDQERRGLRGRLILRGDIPSKGVSSPSGPDSALRPVTVGPSFGRMGPEGHPLRGTVIGKGGMTGIVLPTSSWVQGQDVVGR